MSASPFQKIIFPALIASGTVFAALTVPLAPVGGSPAAAPLPEPIKEFFSPLLQYEQKKLSIRYIGFSIVSSVVVGVGTAEVMRTFQKQRQRSHDLLQLLTQSAGDTDAPEPYFSAHFPTEINAESATPWGTPQPTNWLKGLDQEPVPGWGTAEQKKTVDAPQRSLFTANPSHPWHIAESADGPSPWAKPNDTPDDSFNGAVDLTPQDADLAGDLTPCRIQLPGSEQRVLAIQVEGEYYSFFRLRSTQAQAQAMVDTLAKRGQTAMITPHVKGHVVWVKQPQAKADKESWEQWQMIA